MDGFSASGSVTGGAVIGGLLLGKLITDVIVSWVKVCNLCDHGTVFGSRPAIIYVLHGVCLLTEPITVLVRGKGGWGGGKGTSSFRRCLARASKRGSWGAGPPQGVKSHGPNDW